MKRFFTFIALLIVLSIFNGYAQTDFTVLYLNDTHSFLAPTGPRTNDLQGTQGGIARAASILGYYKGLNPLNTLILDAGDFSIGDPTYFAPIVDNTAPLLELTVLGYLGADAITFGNHEFDFGVENLTKLIGQSFVMSDPVPFLSANATDVPAELEAYMLPDVTKTVGDVKIGIFGLTTPAANQFSNPAPIVFDEDLAGVAAAKVTELKAAGCNFIICLSHDGIQPDKLITEVPGIDLIVGGHDHLQIPAIKVNNTWIVQTQGFFKEIGKIDFRVADGQITLLGNQFITLDSKVPEDETVKGLVDQLIAGVESAFGPIFTQQIANSNCFFDEYVPDVFKAGNHSTATGNFVANALKWFAQTDFAIEPGGSTAQPIFKGPIVPADLFRIVGYGAHVDVQEQMMPGYAVTTFKITGANLYAALEVFLGMMTDDEFLPQLSGMSLKYNPDAPEGKKVESILINKMPLDPSKVYTVATNYLVYSIMLMLQTEYGIEFIQSDVDITPYSEFDALLAYTTQYLSSKLLPDLDARVIAMKRNVKKDGDLAEVPAEFTLSQNYPNPFNPSTNIEFSMPADSKVRLSVYNVIGEEVAVLIDEFRSAGTYNERWDAVSLPAGVYIYKLQADGVSQTRKMMLLK